MGQREKNQRQQIVYYIIRRCSEVFGEIYTPAFCRLDLASSKVEQLLGAEAWSHVSSPDGEVLMLVELGLREHRGLVRHHGLEGSLFEDYTGSELDRVEVLKITYSVLTRSVRLHGVHLVSVEQSTEESSSLGLHSRLVDVGSTLSVSTSHLTKVFLLFNYLNGVAARLINLENLGMRPLTTFENHH